MRKPEPTRISPKPRNWDTKRSEGGWQGYLVHPTEAWMNSVECIDFQDEGLVVAEARVLERYAVFFVGGQPVDGLERGFPVSCVHSTRRTGSYEGCLIENV
jgi:hypothetical protein